MCFTFFSIQIRWINVRKKKWSKNQDCHTISGLYSISMISKVTLYYHSHLRKAWLRHFKVSQMNEDKDGNRDRDENGDETGMRMGWDSRNSTQKPSPIKSIYTCSRNVREIAAPFFLTISIPFVLSFYKNYVILFHLL